MEPVTTSDAQPAFKKDIRRMFKPTDTEMAKIALNRILNKPLPYIEIVIDGEIQKFSPAFIASGLYMAASVKDATKIYSQAVYINRVNRDGVSMVDPLVMKNFI